MTDEAERITFDMGGHAFSVAVSHDPARPEAESWEAVADELGGCRGAGSSRELALEELRGAIVRYVAADLLDP